jgi:3'-phosphoadenosine 5'-phosphosulfate (PAPS) 3'-phosphatase
MDSFLDVQGFLNFTVSLARHCGATVLEHFIKTGKNVEAVEKANRTNVTQADLTIQYIL